MEKILPVLLWVHSTHCALGSVSSNLIAVIFTILEADIQLQQSLGKRQDTDWIYASASQG